MSPAIRPFHNVLAIVGASPGHLCLEKKYRAGELDDCIVLYTII